MKGHSVARVVLVMALVIGVTGFAVSILAQTERGDRAAVNVPAFTAPERADSAPQAPSDAAGYTLSQVNVCGQALRPKYSLVDYDYIAFGGGAIYATTHPGEPFSTQVYLPQGATIYGLRIYFYRLNTTYTCSAYLKAYNQYGALVTSWAMPTGSWTGFNWGNDTSLSHVVNNSTYRYMLEWAPGQASSNMALTSFTIFLQVPLAPTKAAVIPLY